eukprot:CAMPEP_0203923842 /NCGR_PEP_ID=MMETSP0359-20131031/63662_1 /ASSEMBLY_ACC=CAM_ASM_000338 /TAXON_ID=268821 /ORGANISM="Scrippsiella Hangoei, Strain SHTV-5" /LENGTH=497 /DNA_ID=CAMNT_0050851971 /DNA_START=18 /DNA_END=1508 /DNA_ORIENTATION=-
MAADIGASPLPTPAGPAAALGPSAAVLQVHRLRDFRATPASGSNGRARWQQSMGSLELRLLLRGSPWEGTSPDEFQVRLCEQGLRVANLQRPEASDAFLKECLCGDFPREVLVGSSWWTLEADVERREHMLVVHLTKAKDGSWPVPFREGPLVEARELSSDWTALRPGGVAHSRGPGLEEADLGLQASELFEELVESQTEDFVTLRLLLKQNGLEQARRSVPMSRLWGLDLTEDNLRVFLRSRGGVTLLSGRFGGRVQPAQTEWGMVKVTREVSGGVCETRPALEVQLRKATDYRHAWDPLLVRDAQGIEVPAVGAAADNSPERKLPLDAPLGELDVDADSSRFPELEGQEARTPTEHAMELKARGDDCFKRRQWDAAIELYGRALGFTPDAEAVLSNRSAALAEAGQYQAALDDALRAAEVAPQWPKAYFRQGVALRALRRYDMAISVFSEGLARDPKNPSWKREIEDTEAKKAVRQAEEVVGVDTVRRSANERCS